MIYLFILVILLFLIVYLIRPSKATHHAKVPFPDEWEMLLKENVAFYNKLDDVDKQRYKERIQRFIDEVRITGVMSDVDDRIKLLVASSAIIPVFNFEEWEYLNLNEVLVYDGMVETNLEDEEENRNRILGQVRPFQSRHILLLSRQSLEKGFESMSGKENVGIHEFAHMVDEADGNIDGLPKIFMSKDLLSSWTKLMFKEIEKIKQGNSDINPYGVTNHAEFFAVVCEYFFENPEKFKRKHQELYHIMSQAFRLKE